MTVRETGTDNQYKDVLTLWTDNGGIDSGPGIYFKNTGAKSIARIKALDAGTCDGNLVIETSQGGACPGDENTTEVMRVTSTGNVGIGTTTPAAKLDVAGNIKTSGVVQGAMSSWTTGVVDPPDITTTYAPIISLPFTLTKPATIQACYSLTCTFRGNRTWIGIHLDGGAQNETGWHENDLNIGAFSVTPCATWINVPAGSHTITIQANHNQTGTTNCWRAKLDVNAFYLTE